MKEFNIKANEAGQRLDKFIKKVFPESNTSFVYKMLRKKNITLNDKRAEGNEILKLSDSVKFFFSDESFEKLSMNNKDTDSSEYESAYAKYKNIEVVFEGEDFLVVNKPDNLLTQKAQNSDISLNEWLIGYLLSKKVITKESLKTFKPSVLNRLDRNTTGLVICSKTLKGAQEISEALKNRTIKKYYYALVLGCIDKAFIYEAYLKKDEDKNIVTIKDEKFPDSVLVKTGIEPVKFTNDFSLVKVDLITGKTHQIRAVLSYLGHPIVGDIKYGKENKKTANIKRQLLHARELILSDGTKIEADLPKDFDSFISTNFN